MEGRTCFLFSPFLFFSRLPQRWRLRVPDRPSPDTVIFNSRCGFVLPHLRLDGAKASVGCWTILAILSRPGVACPGGKIRSDATVD